MAHSKFVLNIFKSSKFVGADWSRICSMSVSSGCAPGAAPAWWPVPGLGWTELVEGPTLPLSPPRLLYCHMPDNVQINHWKSVQQCAWKNEYDIPTFCTEEKFNPNEPLWSRWCTNISNIWSACKAMKPWNTKTCRLFLPATLILFT